MMNKFAMALLLVSAVPGAAFAAPPSVARSVATTTARSPDNVKLDEGRKPAELLAFLGLKPGMRVLDPFGGNLYWAEITAPAVGPKGRVVVWEPTQFASPKGSAAFAEFAAKQPNVAMMASPFEAPSFAPAAYDFALINLDYHDVYWISPKNHVVRMDPDKWLHTLFAAMKPGAVVGVVDHVAAAGSDPRESVEKFHRIDPAVVRADFERAGFVLDGTSDMLRNPADDHSLLVFNPGIRGKTDRFVMKFRKPAA